MATVSFRVPEELKERMEEHDEINWSALLRRSLEEEIGDLEDPGVTRALATSERLSREIDPADVGEGDTAEVIREFRDARYGGESA